MPSNYQRLLEEADARRVLLAAVTYDAGSGPEMFYSTNAEWVTERTDSLPDIGFESSLLSTLNVSTAIDAGESLGGVAVPELGALEWDNLDGAFDDWRTYRVDGLSLQLLLVGQLKDGTIVTYDDAIGSPLVDGKGIGKPKVSDKRMTIAFNGALYPLRRVLNKKVFSPPCPSFPGTSAGNVDFGDHFDAAGTFTWGFWIYTTDPTATGQLVFSKDTGSAGYYLDLGTAGAGALRFGIRGQTPLNTDTSAGVILINRWHHVAVQWNAATTTRTIFIDGVAIATSTGVTGGSPGGNSASFKVGAGFFGMISKGDQYSIAQTATQIRADIFLPLLGNETSLTALPLMQEGKGTTTADGKSGSVVAGALGTGVTWKTSGWCGESLVGKRWPLVLGKVFRSPLTPLDPALGIFATSWPPPVGPPSIYSNQNSVLSGYTYDSTRGLVTLTVAATGKYSADLRGESMFSGAASYDGSTAYASGTVACPADDMSLACMFRPDDTSNTVRRIAGWTAGAGAGQRVLQFFTNGKNQLRWVVRNDAGVAFAVDRAPGLLQGRYYVAVGVLDTKTSEIRLYVDGALVGSTLVTGTFTTTASAFTLARNSTTSSEFFAGVVDSPQIWSSALTLADAEALTVAPPAVGSVTLAQHWPCDAGSGSTLANSEAGGATLTLSGTYAWSSSRRAPADCINVILTRYCGYSTADLSMSTIAAYIRQTAAECGWMVDSDESALDVADVILRGVGSWLRPSTTGGLLEMGQVQLPTGTPDDGADFDGDAIPKDATIEPADERIAAPIYGVNVRHARNWSPMAAEQLAGILTTQPALYQFGSQEWRDGLDPDLDVLEDYPQAEILAVDSPLLLLPDALAESVRTRPFYGPDRERYVQIFKTPALGLQVAGEMRVTVETDDDPPQPVLGMGNPGKCFAILAVTREEERVTVRGLA